MTLPDQTLESALLEARGVRIIPYDLNRENLVFFDFTSDNPELRDLDVSDTRQFTRYIFQKLGKENSSVGIGRYDENRTIYDKSSVFGSSGDSRAGRRTLHIGLDLWVAPGTPVLAALDGTVHSFQDNRPFGDYGPTIILKHELKGISFCTLYGHLNRGCLDDLKKGLKVRAGQEIARVGDIHENGQWPPHLHFEIIRDLQGKEGDFPGVCALEERDRYLSLCPDPNLLLKINALDNW